MPAPQKMFGFEYQDNGRAKIIDVQADSVEEAQQLLARIGSAKFIGRLCPDGGVGSSSKRT